MTQTSSGWADDSSLKTQLRTSTSRVESSHLTSGSMPTSSPTSQMAATSSSRPHVAVLGMIGDVHPGRLGARLAAHRGHRVEVAGLGERLEGQLRRAGRSAVAA